MIPETIMIKVNISSINPLSIHLNPFEPIMFSVCGVVIIVS
jgi:hypothetical protein